MSEEKENQPPSIDEIINSWKQKYGEETLSKGEVPKPYWRIDLKNYNEFLNILLKTMIKYGYKKEDIDSKFTLSKIKKVLTPDIYDKDSLDKWNKLIESVWEFYSDKEFVNKNIEFVEYSESFKPSPTKTSPELPPIPSLPQNFEGWGELIPTYDEEFLNFIKDIKKDSE